MTDAAPSLSLAERQIALLGELADIGMEVARAIGEQVKLLVPQERFISHKDLASMQSLSLALDRVSRSIRLTLMLQTKLNEAPPDPTAERRATVHRILTRIAERERRPRDIADRLITERLDREFCGDILNRPISDLIALICKDIGLNPDWPRLRAEHWAKEEIASSQIGGPLQGHPPDASISPTTLPLNGEGQGWGVAAKVQTEPITAV